MKVLYTITSTLGFVVRNFILPNPFENSNFIFYGITIPPQLANIIIEPLLFFVTYWIVGLYYEEGTNPAWGSLLYLAFYCVHVLIIYSFNLVNFKSIGVFLIIGIYIAINIIISEIKKEKFS